MGVAGLSTVDSKSAAVKMAAVKMVLLMRSAERLRPAEVREQWAVLAQRLIERDDRNVRKTRRKGARRSWYKIPPWGDP